MTRRKNGRDGQSVAKANEARGLEAVRPAPSRHTATKREKVTRAELRERRKAETAEPKERVPLRERFSSLGSSIGDAVRSHPRALFAIFAVVLSIAMIYGPVRGYYVATRTNEELQAYYDALVEQNEELRSDLSRLQTREGIEDEAHKRGLIYDGEKIVQVEGLTGEVSSPMPEIQVEDCRPWYIRVLDFVFGYEFGVWQ